MTTLFAVAFDGIALGMLLFIMTIGLSVTLGIMNFINLAHGAFAMGGGYLLIFILSTWGIGFLPALLLTTAIFFLIGIFIERILFQHFYSAEPLTQVLLTLGLIFMSIATATYFFGSRSISIQLPSYLDGYIGTTDVNFSIYRTTIIIVGGIFALLLWFVLDYMLVGARVRAAVSNRHMAENIGINVPALFSILFGLGSALAAIGGALSINVVGMNPTFAFNFLVLELLIVVAGGMGTIRGTFLAALLFGVLSSFGKFLLPQGANFLTYAIALAVLLWRPYGLIPGLSR